MQAFLVGVACRFEYPTKQKAIKIVVAITFLWQRVRVAYYKNCCLLEIELPKLELERKYIRFEVFSSGNKADSNPTEYSIKVINRGEETTIKASSNETVLCAFERAGIEVPARYHTGECGFCKSKLVSGKVYIPEGEDKRRIADLQFNYIHPCCCFPESNLVVRIN